MLYEGVIIGDLFKEVDRYGAQFVSETYHQLVTSYASVAYLFATLYLGFIFLEIKRGIRGSQDLPFIVLRMVAILTVALNYNYFCLFIYDVFTNGPLAIAKAITVSASNHLEVTDIGNALDQFLKEGLGEATTLFKMGSWTNPTYSLFGGLLFLATCVSVAIAVGLIFLAKIGSTIILALSPLFIFFVLFESTKGWFDSFIQHLFTYALIPVLTSAVLMIVLSVTTTTVQYMQADKPTFKSLIPFLLACMVQVWLFLQVPQKCASLASGFNLKGLMATFSDAKKSASTLGNILSGGKYTRAAVSGASRLAGQLLKKGGVAAIARLQKRNDRFKNPTNFC